MGRPVARVLVIHPGALGDTLLALPVLAGLKESYAPAFLELIGHPALLGVLPSRSIVDQMRSIDGPEWLQLLEDGQAIPTAAKALFATPDLAIAWMADRDGRVRATLTGLGSGRVIVQSPRLREPGHGHATERFQATLTELDRPIRLIPAPLVPTAHDVAAGRAWMAQAGFDLDRTPVVAVHPGSGSLFKCWPADEFATLMAGLQHEGAGVLVIEGPADRVPVEEVRRRLASVQVRCLANADLVTVLGVLAHCRAFVGNDSGLTHVAARLGLPTVCLFGPTDPAVWAPRGGPITVLRGESVCTCTTDEEKRQCLHRCCLAVSASRVREALLHAVFDVV
jgi:ADP-heptose:LPS heptosyltransferase